MKALVTGGCGHIGGAIARHLLDRGDEVVLADIAGAEPGSLRTRAKLLTCDVSDAAAVQTMVVEAAPDVIYHMGGLLNRVSEADPMLSFEVNVRGSLNVFEAARAQGVGRVFFASTRGTWGLGIGDRVDDYTLQRPDTFYGCGKLYIENVGRWYRTNRGVDIRSLRIPTILSPGIRTKGHWAPAMIDDAIAGRAHYAEFAAPSDNGVFLHIDDCARAAVELMSATPEQTPEVNYAIAGMNEMTTAQEMYDFLRGRFPGFCATFRDTTEPRVTTKYIDDSRARADWGWRPRYDTLDKIVDGFVALPG